MREGNFLRLVSTRRHHSWRTLGKILKFEFPRSPENCLSEGFLPPFSKHKPYVFMLSTEYEILFVAPPSQTAKNSAPQASPSFSRLLGTGVGKKNVLDIVQMKRNGSNCLTGRNLDKLSLSLKMREESHFMCDA